MVAHFFYFNNYINIITSSEIQDGFDAKSALHGELTMMILFTELIFLKNIGVRPVCWITL